MPKSTAQKKKIPALERIMQRYTDEEHGLTVQEIIGALEEEGICAERKSVYDDIETLCDLGMDIVKIREKGRTEYRLVSREFELAELKLLVDSVQASKFITPKKSDELISKLSSLASERESRQLARQVYVSGRVKTMNESIYYSVDKIHAAIRDNRKISFLYCDRNEKKEKVYRHGGRTYVISPFVLTWSDENYYLIAYDSDAEKIKHYRVDKMERLEITELMRDGHESFADFDMARYSREMFGMYGGRNETVTLRCRNTLSGAVIDRFGEDILFRPDGTEHFLVTVRVYVSVHFLTWVMNFAPDITVCKPESVRGDMLRLAQTVMEQYKQEEANAD